MAVWWTFILIARKPWNLAPGYYEFHSPEEYGKALNLGCTVFMLSDSYWPIYHPQIQQVHLKIPCGVS
jgi:hypothetical protein